MAEEFDIYLKDHLTEFDLIIYSMPYRERISATACLVVDATVQDTTLCKSVEIQPETELDMQVDQITKRGFNELDASIVLDSSACATAHKEVSSEESTTLIGIDDAEVSVRVTNGFDTGLVLSASPVETQAIKHTGEMDASLLLGVGLSSNHAKKEIETEGPVIVDSSATVVVSKAACFEEGQAVLDSQPVSIYMNRYRLLSDLTNLTFADVNNMTLEEFYLIQIA